jgi:hypothetical protein
VSIPRSCRGKSSKLIYSNTKKIGNYGHLEERCVSWLDHKRVCKCQIEGLLSSERHLGFLS